MLSRLTPLLALLPLTLAQNTISSNEPGRPVQFAQPCGADLLLDDFSSERVWTAPSGEVKRANAIGGDWGIWGGNFTIDTSAKTLTIVPRVQPTPYLAEGFNPDTVPTFNFFYTQFTNQHEIFDKACANLTAFNALEFEAVAPAGFDFNITFTQRLQNDCEVRTYDSQYQLFSKYYTTPGQKQTIRLPLSDFSKDLSGANFNYQWNKDITLVNLAGANPGDAITISNVVLKGAPCSGTATTSTSTSSATVSGAPSATSAGGASATQGAGSGGESLSVGMAAMAGAVALAAGALI
ncbi:hypothetical protein HK097_000599 [Rhizophlyctis rosea]|uniref:Uncharacterized protein n=1 Tax=Rhizophlyctis rosea TaxID=64517 RepID=A0AAD5X2H3_9FUNG|nr:hypothetical protein HK097_000599 [Rhizophlyctis rosea]